MKKFIIILFVIVNIISLAGTKGKIAGIIKDASTGEPLIGANVIIVGTNLGSATDINGYYAILNIPPGTYQIKISSIGFKTIIIDDVKVVADRTTEISVSLQSTTVEMEEIKVFADKPMIQKDLTSSISVISRDEIENLPVANFTDLLQLQAGVIGSGNNLHIRGGRSSEVAYMIDGVTVTDPLLGGLGTDINNDAIQELSLLSGTFNAEYGNALSGVVNIVTRDGGDKFAGKIEVLTSEFGIKEFTDFHELRINGNISGPLLIKNLNFFISAEQDKRGSYLPFGYRNGQTFFTKLSYSGIYGMKLSISNRGSLTERKNYNHEWKYIPEQYTRRKEDSYQSSFTLTHTLDKNIYYDFKISYFNQGFYSGIGKDTSQYLKTSEWEYLSTAGTGFEFWQKADPTNLTDSRTARIDSKVDFVWQIGSINEVKFGVQFIKHWLRLWQVDDPKRTFPYIDNYKTNPFEISSYVQDKIEFPYLVINLGVRLDYLNSNAEYRSNPLDPNSIAKSKAKFQISPRFGIAHPISSNTKLHFAYGHFFQNPNFEFLFENKQYDLNVREPLFGQPNLDAQRTIAYEVGVSHQLTDKIAISLTAYYKDVTGLLGTRYYFPYTEGRYTGYTVYINEDYANMKGFEINIDARADKYFSGGLSYTYSIAKGNASSETEQYPGTQESTLLYYLDFDKTHLINVNANLMIPENEGPQLFGIKPLENFDASIIFRASSGYPYTPSGRDIGFVIKNSLRMPMTYTIDLECGKTFSLFNTMKLRAFIQVLNLTNHRNVLNVYGDTGEPDVTYVGQHSEEWIKDPSNFGPPRLIKIGLTLRY